jgi:F0F1-type ATP synthase membrane subunit a
MISYVFRPISLGVRLFVNIMAGHVLIKVFVGFFFIFVQSSFIIMIIPQLVIFSSVSILILLELVIAILQSYIFTLLTCMYINDALNIH